MKEGGKREPLSLWHQQVHRGMILETRLEREGSKKTLTDVEGLQRQISELLEQRQKDQKTILGYEATVAKRDDTIRMAGIMKEGLRRSYVRVQGELETVRRDHSALKERWSALQSDVRKAGRRLQDLGQ